MELRRSTFLAVLLGVAALAASASAAPDSQFDGSSAVVSQAGAVPVGGRGGYAQPLGAADGSIYVPPDEPPSPNLPGGPYAGAAIGAVALGALAQWGLPALGLCLGPAGVIGLALAGGAVGAYVMHDKPLAAGLGAAGVGVGLAAASCLFPPIGIAAVGAALGLGAYFIAKNIFG